MSMYLGCPANFANFAIFTGLLKPHDRLIGLAKWRTVSEEGGGDSVVGGDQRVFVSTYLGSLANLAIFAIFTGLMKPHN